MNAKVTGTKVGTKVTTKDTTKVTTKKKGVSSGGKAGKVSKTAGAKPVIGGGGRDDKEGGEGMAEQVS